MNALLIELALAYYREPLRYPRLSDPHSPLPAGFANLIPPFGAALAPRHLAATAAAMAARPAEVREAARFFVRQVLLAPGASPQRILGFEAEAEASPVRIRQHYHLLIRLFHPDRQTHLADLDTENAARINAAYEALRGEAALEHTEHAEEEAAAAAIASDELRQFFQPQQRIVPLRVPGTGRSSWRRLDRRMGRVAALLLVVGSIGFILVALTQPDTVHLHLPASHDPATPTAPQPYYLHGTTKTSPEAKVARVQVAGSTYLASPASPAATPQERGEEERQAALAAAQREQAEAAQAEAERLEAERQALAAAQREQAEAAQAEAQRQEAERQALARQQAEQAERAERARRERQEAQRREAERQAALAAAQREQEAAATAAAQRQEAERQAAKAAAQRQAERQALERQQAEQARREQKQAEQAAQARREQQEAQRREAERQAALAAAQREREAAAKAEAQRQEAERQALERQQAEQARRERQEAQRQVAASKAAADPNQVIARLTHSYAAGELDGFVNLFTPDARVTGGRGKSFIRSDYRAFFSAVPYRRLEITGIRWQADPTGRLSGTGSLQVKTRQQASDPWTHLQGTVRFELVPLGGDYQISRMEHTVQ